jgi:hypothetical protein
MELNTALVIMRRVLKEEYLDTFDTVFILEVRFHSKEFLFVKIWSLIFSLMFNPRSFSEGVGVIVEFPAVNCTRPLFSLFFLVPITIK